MTFGLKALAGVATLAGTILGGSLFADRTQAAYHICRLDPTVTLSTGTSVVLWTDVSTDDTNVSAVKYVFHAPRGVSIKSVAYDAGTSREHVSLVNDMSSGQYQVMVTVTTSDLVKVKAYATLGGTHDTQKVTGKSNRSLLVSYWGGANGNGT